jgi:prevent-host-death family protein
MKVKTAELKARLSYYLRQVREGGESVIVCDRDTPVAVLSPLDAKPELVEEQNEIVRIQDEMRRQGISFRKPISSKALAGSYPAPVVAPDGRTDRSTVEEMRREKDY